ncbi:MAG: ABC transporter permease [Planctomycetes bacterium]|nr:ABC transporter permease [Planctomycetota bacterium]
MDDRVAAEVEAELEFHLAMVTEELERQGWGRAEALLEARRRFGDLDETRRYCGEQDLRRERGRNRMTYLTELTQDLRFTLRSLRRAPGFTAVVLLTLGLGIGANTAIFSVVRGVLLEPLPFAEPERLVRIWHENRSASVARAAVSEPDFLDWRRESRLAEQMGAFFHMDGLSGVDLTGDGPPTRLASALVAEGFFETLGARALHGRTLSDDDQLSGRNQVAVLGFGTWRTHFNGDPAVVGRTIQLNGASFEVVGVMPEHFAYPADRDLDVWLPLSYFGPNDIGRARRAPFQGVVARLRPGVSVPQLQQELGGIAARLATEYPENRGWETVSVLPLREALVGNVSRPLALLLGGVFLVLLITCANVASLLLARATVRQRELAVRAALGAGRGRITRQLLTESLVLASGGGLIGVLFAYWAVRGVTASGLDIPRAALVAVDGPVFAFAFGLALLAGVLFGVTPSLRAAGGALGGALREGGRGSLGGGVRLRRALVVLQVALAVVLVTAAALTTKSFSRLQSVDLGFDPAHALFVEMSVSDRHGSRAARQAYYDGVLDAIAALPGVEAVGAIRDLPTRGRGEISSVRASGAPDDPSSRILVQFHQVSGGYFDAMRIPLRAGRTFDSRDGATAALVVVVDEEYARRAFGDDDPTRHALRFGDTDVPIVGVVGSVRQAGPAEPVEPAIYLHAPQSHRSRMSIVVRTAGDPLAIAASVRGAIRQLDPLQAINTVTTLDAVLGRAVSRPRLLASLFAMFGLLGLSLGAMGVYGVLAFSVTQRRQEIGVRLALGASPRSVLAMVVRQGMTLALLGVAIGVVGALATTGAMQAVLFGIEAADFATFAQVAGVVAVTALLASWVPARRATRVDPAVALRAE